MASSHSGDSHNHNNEVSAASSEKMKQNESRPEAKGDIAKKPNVDVEPGQ